MRKIYSVFGIILALFIDGYTYALCVNTWKANIRTGPGTNYENTWEVYKYMPLLKVGISLSGEWYAVKDVDGDVNWIHKRLVTSRYRCAVVKTEEVNVRTGPGTSYSKCFFSPAKKYYSFRVLKRKGIWVKVRDELNNTGWIHRNYLWIQ
ncbi:MAG: SH3 domain-containing protein [Nitrospirota bacterium]